MMLSRKSFLVSLAASDDRALWQGGFVSMGVGSARLVSIGRRKGCENAIMPPLPTGMFRHMPKASVGCAWQASIVALYSDRIDVTRRDYRYGESIGETWRIDFPFRHNSAAPYLLADSARAPQFPEGAGVIVEERVGMRQPDMAEERQITVKMPAARGDGPYARVFYYRVEVLDADGVVLKESKVVQEDVAFAERRTLRTQGWCTFAVDELPRGRPLRFRVYPQNTSGREGRPITSKPVTLE